MFKPYSQLLGGTPKSLDLKSTSTQTQVSFLKPPSGPKAPAVSAATASNHASPAHARALPWERARPAALGRTSWVVGWVQKHVLI